MPYAHPRSRRVPMLANNMPNLLRPTWMEVDLDRLAHNVKEVRNAIGPERKLIAVAKADGYGHGLLEVAPVMIESGADIVAVANVNDGVRLREAGFRAPILLFGGYLAEDAAQAIVKYELLPTVWDVEGARHISNAACKPLEVCLKVDTGFNRLGVAPERAAEVARGVEELPHLRISIIYTHFADPIVGREFTQEQFTRFRAAVSEIRATGVSAPYACAASSAIVSTRPDMYLNAVDPGRVLYGFYYPTDPPIELTLAPVVRAVKTRIIQLKWVETGKSVGYGRGFYTSRRTRVGVLPMGWCDGLLRSASGKAQLLVREVRCPIIGAINVEHCMIDVTDVKSVAVGDEAVLFGEQGSAVIRAHEHAAWVGVSETEVVVLLGRTIPRIYLGHGRPVGRL